MDAQTRAVQTEPHRPATQMDEAMLILREMDRALAFHLIWLKDLHRTLICAEPPRPEDLAHDAHCRCNYGRWFYGLEGDFLTREPGIADLATPHRVMHDAARHLLVDHAAGLAVAPAAYEAFMDLATDFKQKMRDYQLELVQRVCSRDHLTGVWNRNSMTMQLAAEAERARRNQQTCTLCVLDLDHFKQVNDHYGHLAGDRVLQEVACFIKDHLRVYDSLFRYGGEEFLICLPDTRLEEAEPLLNRLRQSLSTHAISLANQVEVRITASFGVAAMEPDGEVSLAIERADHALLCAKGKGRNRVCTWSLAGASLQVSSLDPSDG